MHPLISKQGAATISCHKDEPEKVFVKHNCNAWHMTTIPRTLLISTARTCLSTQHLCPLDPVRSVIGRITASSVGEGARGELRVHATIAKAQESDSFLLCNIGSTIHMVKGRKIKTHTHKQWSQTRKLSTRDIYAGELRLNDWYSYLMMRQPQNKESSVMARIKLSALINHAPTENLRQARCGGE